MTIFHGQNALHNWSVPNAINNNIKMANNSLFLELSLFFLDVPSMRQSSHIITNDDNRPGNKFSLLSASLSVIKNNTLVYDGWTGCICTHALVSLHVCVCV